MTTRPSLLPGRFVTRAGAAIVGFLAVAPRTAATGRRWRPVCAYEPQAPAAKAAKAQEQIVPDLWLNIRLDVFFLELLQPEIDTVRSVLGDDSVYAEPVELWVVRG